jgi:hypothetical protein
VRNACPKADVKDGLSIRGSNRIERRLGTGVKGIESFDFRFQVVWQFIHLKKVPFVVCGAYIAIVTRIYQPQR